MISVLNRAAISLQVSGIARPVAPSGAGILALHAGTGGPLLDVASLINHEHGIRAAQVLDDIAAHVIADRIGVPPGRR